MWSSPVSNVSLALSSEKRVPSDSVNDRLLTDSWGAAWPSHEMRVSVPPKTSDPLFPFGRAVISVVVRAYAVTGAAKTARAKDKATAQEVSSLATVLTD